MNSKKRTATEKALDDLADRLTECTSLRTGSIAFQMPGRGGGEYRLDCQPGAAQVAEGLGQKPHQVEVIGSPAKIRSLIEGEHDAVKVFLGGGIRLRGDIRYASDLALELGLIEEPL